MKNNICAKKCDQLGVCQAISVGQHGYACDVEKILVKMDKRLPTDEECGTPLSKDEVAFGVRRGLIPASFAPSGVL